jgi:dimethylargininase
LACRQHEAYERLLADLGCTVHRLPVEPDLPDSVFIEDTCVVLDELAVIARPGADSRRPETRGVAERLRSHRRLHAVAPPGTLDGGDVLTLGKTIYVGLSTRSNQAAVSQLQRVLEPWGYAVRGVPVQGCLHLKSAATVVARKTLLVNRAWVDPGAFGDVRLIDVDPEEPTAANALLLGDRVILPSGFPRTARRLAAAEIRVAAVDVSELQKAEGGVTCCSVIYEASAAPLTLP